MGEDFLPLPTRAHARPGSWTVAPVSRACAAAWIESYNQYVDFHNEVGLPDHEWPAARISFGPAKSIVSFEPLVEPRRWSLDTRWPATHPWTLVMRVFAWRRFLDEDWNHSSLRRMDASKVEWAGWRYLGKPLQDLSEAEVMPPSTILISEPMPASLRGVAA